MAGRSCLWLMQAGSRAAMTATPVRGAATVTVTVTWTPPVAAKHQPAALAAMAVWTQAVAAVAVVKVTLL